MRFYTVLTAELPIQDKKFCWTSSATFVTNINTKDSCLPLNLCIQLGDHMFIYVTKLSLSPSMHKTFKREPAWFTGLTCSTWLQTEIVAVHNMLLSWIFQAALQCWRVNSPTETVNKTFKFHLNSGLQQACNITWRGTKCDYLLSEHFTSPHLEHPLKHFALSSLWRTIQTCPGQYWNLQTVEIAVSV